ncbi:peptidase C45 acyl-coenzyme A:6-aminopenicillanic acid acyl-transferase [Halenospora varia]|nr:peptidase C45 acyl-coenzyme A:6-aminopenicillanic acid acyl-transferase [Halenospora varia]
MSPMLLPPQKYEHIVVSGNAYERGFQHGTKAGAKVRFNVDTYRHSASLPSADICSYYINDVYLPVISDKYPEGIEEMKGIADGANVGLSDIVLLNSRYDLSRITRQAAKDANEDLGECTSMGIMIDPEEGETGPGQMFIAQNWDMSPWMLDNDTIIILEAVDPAADNKTKPRTVITLTEAGQLARSGMNSMGMSVCANSLWSSADSYPHKENKSEKHHFMPMSMARRMFLSCPTMATGLRSIYSMPYHMSNNLVFGSSSGIVVNLELTPKQHFASYPTPLTPATHSGISLITHANHFTSAAALANSNLHCTYSGGSSLFRDIRLRYLLELKAKPAGKNKRIGIEELKKAFSDHASYPNSLCEHRPDKASPEGADRVTMTVANVIYDITNREMHVCKGNPCCGIWDVFKI